MSRVIDDRAEWQAFLAREYPGVRFSEDDGPAPGVNAIIEGVLVGRYFSARTPSYGVVFDQPRSCGGKS
ncbi:MAG TPA: hypothetical protein VNL39_02215 [Xanthobacteraceae bacterium]|jgi:hypothetical protein|nr:hypothetical protein [Xanthobacteraceae bacterium]